LPGYAKKIAQHVIEGMPDAMWAELEKQIAKQCSDSHLKKSHIPNNKILIEAFDIIIKILI